MNRHRLRNPPVSAQEATFPEGFAPPSVPVPGRVITGDSRGLRKREPSRKATNGKGSSGNVGTRQFRAPVLRCILRLDGRYR